MQHWSFCCGFGVCWVPWCALRVFVSGVPSLCRTMTRLCVCCVSVFVLKIAWSRAIGVGGETTMSEYISCVEYSGGESIFRVFVQWCSKLNYIVYSAKCIAEWREGMTVRSLESTVLYTNVQCLDNCCINMPISIPITRTISEIASLCVCVQCAMCARSLSLQQKRVL